MHGRSIVVAFALSNLVITMGAAQQTEQTAKQQSSDSAHARRSVAVNTLRAINTAEYAYRTRHGSFVPWEILVASKEFNGGMHFAAQDEAQLANSRFSRLPEILPGWALRLNVTPDGKGYDVLLEDMTDKACGYAAITNESGLIRQSKTIDCDI